MKPAWWRSTPRWLRTFYYRPMTLHIPVLTRLGARLTMAHISFADQLFDRRLAGLIDTVTVDSVFEWLPRARLGGPVHVLRTLPVKPEPLRNASFDSAAWSRNETAGRHSICAMSRTAPVSAEVVIAA